MKRFCAGLVVLAFLIGAHSVSAAPYAYITQVNLGTLTVFDTVKNKKVAIIDVGGNGRSPLAIAMSPDGRKAYVSSEAWNGPLSPMVYVIDVLTHTVTATIPVGAYPIGTAILPNGSKLYVAGYTGAVPGGLPGISIIDTATNTVETTIPFGIRPYTVAVLPDSSKVYVTDYDDFAVYAACCPNHLSYNA
jgi:YVTN family beta-propeller protein